MIKPINFMGRAYFLNDALKTITPEQKKRIEDYAAKKDEDTDVIVLGAQKQYTYADQTRIYGNELVSLNPEDSSEVIIKTNKGIKKVKKHSAFIMEKTLPAYNAYIVKQHNRENVSFSPDLKIFDFKRGAKSTITDYNGKIKNDIAY